MYLSILLKNVWLGNVGGVAYISVNHNKGGVASLLVSPNKDVCVFYGQLLV